MTLIPLLRARRALLVLLIFATTVEAQAVRPIKLKPADAKLEEEFTSISALHELADGRVLVVDSRDARLVVADFKAGGVTQVGRTGGGPGEYRRINGLLALARDSSILPDPANGRWHLLDGARFASVVVADAPVLRVARGNLFGADRAGHVLVTLANPRVEADPGAWARDSSVVALAERSTGRVDTVARLLPRQARITATQNSSGKIASVRVSLTPFSTDEQALLFLDGWVAIARLDPYHVEWRSPDGMITRGPVLPFPATRIDDREKRAYMAAITAANGKEPASPDTRDDWPKIVPPFEAGALRALPDGRLLIGSPKTTANPNTRYDLVDRRGVLVGQVTMSAEQRIAGFGAKSVYVVTTDDNGIQRVSRHAWP